LDFRVEFNERCCLPCRRQANDGRAPRQWLRLIWLIGRMPGGSVKNRVSDRACCEGRRRDDACREDEAREPKTPGMSHFHEPPP